MSIDPDTSSNAKPSPRVQARLERLAASALLLLILALLVLTLIAITAAIEGNARLASRAAIASAAALALAGATDWLRRSARPSPPSPTARPSS